MSIQEFIGSMQPAYVLHSLAGISMVMSNQKASSTFVRR